MNFRELYGFEFGEKRKAKAYPDRTTSDFRFDFKTPNHSEEDVRFFLDLMSMFMGVITFTVLDEKGILFSRTFDANHRGSLSMFVNKDGVDPKAGRPTGHPGIAPPEPRNTWLEPNKTYTLHVHRDKHSDRQPIGVYYYGNDANQVDYGPDIEIPEDGIEMTLGPLKGVFIEIKQ